MYVFLLLLFYFYFLVVVVVVCVCVCVCVCARACVCVARDYSLRYFSRFFFFFFFFIVVLSLMDAVQHFDPIFETRVCLFCLSLVSDLCTVCLGLLAFLLGRGLIAKAELFFTHTHDKILQNFP